MHINLFEIQDIISCPSITKYLLWANIFLGGPYHKSNYLLDRDNPEIIPLLQSIDQFIHLQEDIQIQTQKHYIYHFHYYIPIGMFKIILQHNQHIYLLYDKNILTIYSKIKDINEYLNNLI